MPPWRLGLPDFARWHHTLPIDRLDRYLASRKPRGDNRQSFGRFLLSYNEAVITEHDDDCNSLLQAAAARQPHCDAVRTDSAQSENRSQQLCDIHQSTSRSTTVEVSSVVCR